MWTACVRADSYEICLHVQHELSRVALSIQLVVNLAAPASRSSRYHAAHRDHCDGFDVVKLLELVVFLSART